MRLKPAATIRDVASLMQHHFELTPPVMETDLKSAFRKKCKELHPDIRGDPEDFKRMKEAYDVIISFSDNPTLFHKNGDSGKNYRDMRTVDGVSIDKLGLGLGPLKNGYPCPECHGKGWYKNSFRSYERAECPKCYGERVVSSQEVTCNRCNGSGKFFKDGKEVSFCYRCNGTGKVTLKFRPRACDLCFGRGWVHSSSETESAFYYRCLKCEGTGELEVFNPVLPKNRVR